MPLGRLLGCPICRRGPLWPITRLSPSQCLCRATAHSPMAWAGLWGGSLATPLTSMIRLLTLGRRCRTFQVPSVMRRRFMPRTPTRFMSLAASTPTSTRAMSSRYITSVPASGLPELQCLVRAILQAQRIIPPTASSTSSRASTRSPETSYNSTYIYDTLGDTWSTGPNTNVAHSFTGGTAIGNQLIVVTGFDGSSDTNTVEMATEGGGGSPTPTATGSPTCTPIVINGSITNTDPSH